MKTELKISICLMLLSVVTATSETLDVTIKGLDDGQKTSRQQDYKEAVLDAKRQAIEQAGVTVESKSTVKNAVLQEDFIESNAKAVLLPGFQIMDIGYMQDGTYQIVLTGKVQVQPKQSSSEADSGALLLLMNIYSVPVTFQLNGRPLDAGGKFTALVAMKDSTDFSLLPNIREVKKRYNNLPKYFLYLLKLPAGRHSIRITAQVISGTGPGRNGNFVDAEIIPGRTTFYEYRADPEYNFILADSDFVFEKLEANKKPADTTAAYRQKLRQDITAQYEKLIGFKF
ncbi:MAG: hypothetical protein A2509_09005 [Candidatus Edwardsbacteria bacterium RIFOXYD12_FULL_50_11]|uniref:Uncharacterized protein n=1 Tax=Candidatus Edwardsbacteria bacterium GWF2_54_11 TaxID=1817851 RepID=A0A1F5R322_9BACT|nr:MAG: hypothetical protein A2502_02370 [Candidatus Edwardsbacteria bacterium RifOxyC12_full_54_24]OGF08423.1 MAG: hypothetical protein A2024_06880 [Candidatus Edwardsbacteria bacterium GWF2_54_11]OGF09099.1 MAG: hypothetical protein A2273_10825 [Candidatus Edwardsbacteria bacterium RifOxyA12_full_54_48]OGF12376.1 MAG: hypothetical protein A3K15_00770 [Candidatus Edwardsbacteria bacterium GWE2_54_12]OGF17519.1 MAG: hypothetical protein A2509_09005 [Candidatus Edwardsbacteria bacterium RIFOXYD1